MKRADPPFLRKINLLSSLTVLLLAACAQDDTEMGQPLPEGQYPMTFTTAGIALSVETKATTDNNWEGVQTVAVKVGDEMKPYTVNPSGDYQTATLTSDDPFYWQNTAPIQVSAWWPYTEGSTDMPAVVVQADQSSEDNFHKSDYISAENQQVELGGTKALQFSHRTAKVVLNPLKPGEGMSDSDLAGATIALIGVTTGNEADGNTVTPYQNSIALLPPQTIQANEPFIKVTLGGTTYSYKPQEAINLQADYQYVFTITVNKTGLSGSNATFKDWGKGDEIPGVAMPEPTYTYDEASNTYTVYTAAGLDAWADAIKSDKGNANCTLANDIDYGGKTWGGTGTSQYAGTFDGGGNTLSNMLIPASVGGLVSTLSGTVQNLVLDGVELQTAASYHGLIAGTNDGTIAGCTVLSSCKITCNEVRNANGYIGGIAGNNNGQITRCQAECSFEGSSFADDFGGIAGRNDGSITASSYKGSYNVTDGSFTHTGSLIGASVNSYVTACWTSVTLGSSATMKGMIGSLTSNAGGTPHTHTFTACYWEGDGITDFGFGTQVADSDWTEAINEMNKALGEDFGWHYVAGEDGLPMLVKTE